MPWQSLHAIWKARRKRIRKKEVKSSQNRALVEGHINLGGGGGEPGVQVWGDASVTDSVTCMILSDYRVIPKPQHSIQIPFLHVN